MSLILLITGAAGGLGASIARLAVSRGHCVYGGARDPARVPAGVIGLRMDVQDEASVNAAVAAVMAAQGRIDVLINNAGIGFARATEQTSLDEMARVMDINFMGVVRTCKAVLPHMRAARSGRVVNISSVGGLVGQPFNEVYCASKFALEGYTESLASYVGPAFGIHFTLFEPGGMHSEFAASALKQIAQSGGLLEDEYLPLLQRYLARARERGTSAFQTTDEVAAQVLDVLVDPEPPLRQRTSGWAEALCELKTAADPTGRLLQRQVTELFLGDLPAPVPHEPAPR